ncbi:MULTISPECIES: DNA-binding protein [Ralstonia]|uniref:Core-binding (CB) domain-containing protein n=1 Tax=Ralstonia flatus TaxID=3058601 RepID=A0AAD2F9V9_9RALS|nr:MULTISPECIES: DNA-binding protein [Ralstonia]CAJ0884947.1 hypothetical protein R77567_03713 [Ralstonia sp. LMG 32965]CAJ0900969.1 hypothetical protein R77564_04514 [Ralstonia sp. LMG 32965]
MARAGLSRLDVKRARNSLVAQGQHPSIDAIRIALGNTGSKTTIHRYLKELEEEEGAALTMTDVDRYLEAATRDNTRRSYQSAVRHFEVEWGGFLPASADSIARYLAPHAQTLSINTLRQRLAALAQWHLAQGFPDLTRVIHVRKVPKV